MGVWSSSIDQRPMDLHMWVEVLFYVRWDWPFCLSGGIINQRGSARAVDRVSIAPHQAPQEHNLKTQIKVGYIYWGMCGSKFFMPFCLEQWGFDSWNSCKILFLSFTFSAYLCVVFISKCNIFITHTNTYILSKHNMR